MVINGAARSRPDELAVHLLRTDHNERVHVLDIWGTDAPTLGEALREMDAIGAGARARRTLYHANIDARHDEQLTAAQRRIAVERLGQRLGLDNQPRVVVEHVKHGRHHLHVVWGRIDLETMKAIPDSHNFRKHEEVARELEREFGHERVQGAHHERGGKKRPPRTPSYPEMMQAARSGMKPQDAKERVTECWWQTRTGRSFIERLAAEGFILARGDRRDFVLVDGAGEIHGLSRRIEGVKAADIRERMADVDIESLPDVAGARRRLRDSQGVQAVKGFTSAVERMRKEEKAEEGQGRERAKLSHTDQDIADAVWQLGKTMRGQMANVIPEKPLTPDRPGRAGVVPTVPQPTANTPPPFSQAHAREATGRTRPAVPECETPAPVPARPSVYLFVKMFGWLVDAYKRAFERTTGNQRMEQQSPQPETVPPAHPQPRRKRESLADEAIRNTGARTPAQKLRDRERRGRNGLEREYEPDA